MTASASSRAGTRSTPMSKSDQGPNLQRDPFKALRPRACTLAPLTIAAASAPAPPRLAQVLEGDRGPGKSKIPHRPPPQFAWLAWGVVWRAPPAGLGRGPIRQDPA